MGKDELKKMKARVVRETLSNGDILYCAELYEKDEWKRLKWSMYVDNGKRQLVGDDDVVTVVKTECMYVDENEEWVDC